MQLSHDRWAAFVQRRHRAILVGALVVSALSALSLLRLRMDLDVLNLLPSGRPAFDDFKSFVSDFGQLNELLVLVTTAPETGAATPQLQAFADEFGELIAELDTVAGVQVRIDSGRLLDGVLGRYLFNYLPQTGYEALEKRLTAEGIDAQIAANRMILAAPFDLGGAHYVRDDPLGLLPFVATALAPSYGAGASWHDGYLVAPDGNSLLIVVRPKSSAFDTAFSARLLRQVREAEAGARRAVPVEDVGVDYTGSYVYALEDATTLRRDVRRYTLLALAGVLAVFYLGYRSLRILPFLTFALVAGTLVTFALDLVVYGRLNAVSTAFAAILYGLSIDTGIHFYNRLLDERRRMELCAAVAATLAGLGRATLAVSTTSAIVFVVIGFSCLTGVSQLGVLTAFGVLLNPVGLYLLYPALAFLFPRLVETPSVPIETPRLARLADAFIRHARLVTVAAGVGGIILAIAATRVTLDAGLAQLRPRASAAARVQDEIEQRFGTHKLGGAVLVRRADLDTALADSEAVVRQLSTYREEGLLRSFESVTALLPSERTQRERLARYNRLPRAAAMRTLRAALARNGFAIEPFAAFISGFEEQRHEVVRAGDPALAPVASLIDRHVRGGPGAYTVATYIEPATEGSMREVGERLRHDLSGAEVVVTGRVLLESELRRVLRRELPAFAALALLGNFVLLLVTLGGVRDAVVVLAPVIWALAALLAGMWWAGVNLDPVNLIVPTLILGLGVDYGAYLIAGARERGGVSAAIRSNGRALVVTGFTTVAGFGFLGTSHYPALSGMGLLAAVGLLLALVVSVVLLPALWAMTRR